jgi:hypothetical protein
MKKLLCLSVISFLLPALETTAQQEKLWSDPHIIQKFATEATKDPAYLKLRAEVDALSKTATGKNTNASAVKALLARNNMLLKRIYTKIGIEAPQVMNIKRPKKVINPLIYSKASILGKMVQVNQQIFKTETPPYDASWFQSNQAGFNNVYPDTTASLFSAGKTIFIYGPPPNPVKVRLGQYCQGYLQAFTVPSNPEIIAAEVKFEYSFFYTGWDTYGARTGMDLVVKADNKLNGSSYNELPVYDFPYSTQNVRWKKAATLYPADTITSDFGEFHATADSSFTIEGYVTPGSAITLQFGFGFPIETVRGLNGSYHYAEFILKKITITYYKTAN